MARNFGLVVRPVAQDAARSRHAKGIPRCGTVYRVERRTQFQFNLDAVSLPFYRNISRKPPIFFSLAASCQQRPIVGLLHPEFYLRKIVIDRLYVAIPFRSWAFRFACCCRQPAEQRGLPSRPWLLGPSQRQQQLPYLRSLRAGARL